MSVGIQLFYCLVGLFEQSPEISILLKIIDAFGLGTPFRHLSRMSLSQRLYVFFILSWHLSLAFGDFNHFDLFTEALMCAEQFRS